MLGLGQVSQWSQMSATQFQGHLLESRNVTNNTLGKACGSVAQVDLQEYIYSYRGTYALVEKRYLLKELFFNNIDTTRSYETFIDLPSLSDLSVKQKRKCIRYE